MATVALLEQSPEPTEDEIREALSGNLCRCTGYAKIFDAVRGRRRGRDGTDADGNGDGAGEAGASY